jgi:hypothetical protein
MNKLLRSTNDPLKIYYIQPLIKNLYLSIKNYYHNSKVSWGVDKKEFTCYRGGKINKK